MNCSTPSFPVLHCLPELAQTHVHWVSDAIQPSSLSVTLIFYSPFIFPFYASEYAPLKKKNSGIWQINPWSDHLPYSRFNRLESYWFSARVLLGWSPNHLSLLSCSFSSVAGWFEVAFFQTFRSLITFLGEAKCYGVPIVYPNGVHLVCEPFYPWGTWCWSQWWFSRGIDMYSLWKCQETHGFGPVLLITLEFAV